MARARNAAKRAVSEPAVTTDKLVKEAKKGIGHSEAARNLGVGVGQISSMQWSLALVEAGRYTTAPATSASVRKLYDVERNRWELIAARIGESVARSKELYGSPDDVAEATARRRGNGGNGGGAKGGGKTPSTRGTRGKSSKGKTPTATAAATPRRARTRAERAKARSGNPS